MEKLVASLQKELGSQNWEAALYIALRIPEICGRVSHPDKRLKGRYMWWFKNYLQAGYRKESSTPTMQKWLSKAYPESHQNLINPVLISPEDFYELRRAHLYEGIDEKALKAGKDLKSKLLVAIPSGDKGNIHMSIHNGARVLQLDILCNDIILGYRKWHSELKKAERSRLEIMTDLVGISEI